jgi:hypothetical protein
MLSELALVEPVPTQWNYGSAFHEIDGSYFSVEMEEDGKSAMGVLSRTAQLPNQDVSGDV